MIFIDFPYLFSRVQIWFEFLLDQIIEIAGIIFEPSHLVKSH